MRVQENVQSAVLQKVQSLVLEPLYGLVIRPQEQSKEDAIKGAVTAIGLSQVFAAIGDANGLLAARHSLTLLSAWMVVSAIVARPDRRGLEVARSIGAISFWIAATWVLMLLAELVYQNEMDRGPRLVFVWIGLLALVPIHMMRSFCVWRAVVMALGLLGSAGTLVTAFAR